MNVVDREYVLVTAAPMATEADDDRELGDTV